MKFLATWYPYDRGMEIKKLFEVIEKAEKDGFAGFELVPPIELLPEYSKNTSFFLSKNLMFTVHFDYLETNLCSKNNGIREESVRQLRETIVFAGKIKAKAVVFHPGMYYVEEDSNLAEERLAKVLPLLLNIAKENNVILAIENMENKKQQLCASPEQILIFLEKFPDLMMCFDVAHAVSTATDHHLLIDRMACSLRSGRSLGLLQFSTIRYLEPPVTASLKTGGKLKYYTNQEKSFIAEFWQRCKERIIEVHMSGIKRGMPHYKINLAENSVDIVSFIEQLREFQGLVKLENLDYEDMIISKKYVEKICGTKKR